MPQAVRKNILLVEDEALLAMNEKMQLENYGYAVRTVATGEKAIEAVHTSTDIDLILMDINLGSGIDGTQAAGSILEDHEIPIVFLSSHTEPEVVEKTEKITSYGYVVKRSSITVLDTSIKMAFRLFDAQRRITEELTTRKLIEKALQESEDKFRALFEKGPIGVAYHEMVYDDSGKAIDYRFLDANDSYRELTGVDPRGQLATDAFPGIENDPFDWIGTFAHVAATGEEIRFEQYLQPNDRWYDCVGYQVKQDHFVAAFVEITERKRAEEAQKESEVRFRVALQMSPDGFTILHPVRNEKAEIVDFTWVYENTAIARINGTDPETIVGKQLLDLFPNHLDTSVYETYVHVANTGEATVIEDVSVADIISESKSLRLVVVSMGTDIAVLAQDTTEDRRIKEEVGKQLSEKETLLREVHHRVKNNMATIESFVSLQTGLAATPEVRSALQDVISRVQSMRVLYEKLLQSTDLHEVSIKSYADDLINSLLSVFDREHAVTTETHIADFEIGAKQAFSLGIIINELLTNVFKYAFDSGDRGTVSISIDKEVSTVTLTIQDNGVGFDERALKNESPGFGLTVVKMLVEETGGTYSISNDNGARSVVRFEL